jgi:hypothetical protein
MAGMAGTVTWKNQNEGTFKSNFRGESPCYSKSYAIQLKIMEYCKDLVSSPDQLICLAKGQDIIAPTIKRSFDYLNDIYPRIGYPEKKEILTLIKTKVKPILEEQIKRGKKKNLTEPCSDFEFLFKVAGNLRNWKEDCCYCLTEKIMGTTCGCGHTEIAIFRPCGHSICAQPCFEEFATGHGINLEPKTISTAGMTFTVGGQKNINIKPNNLNCPICRGNIDAVFRAEDVLVDHDFLDFETIATDLINTMDSLDLINTMDSLHNQVTGLQNE